jgi:protein phosphatase
VYGFKDDCMFYESRCIYKNFVKSFLHLPYAAVVNDSIFCVHGGLSPHLTSVREIALLPKPADSSDSPLASDLVWSDPANCRAEFKESLRGTGHLFNERAVEKFLDRNELDRIVRSHEACQLGYVEVVTRCHTVFSNTNYCGSANSGAIAVAFNDGDFGIRKFKLLTPEQRARQRIMVPKASLAAIDSLREISSPSSPECSLDVRL